jgi:hypothetical protein
MNQALPPELVRQSELTGAFAYIQEAVRITKERVTDERLSRRTAHLFETIRLLCSVNREEIDQLRLLAGQLLMGAAEAGHEKNWPLLKREIEYVRGELGKFFN